MPQNREVWGNPGPLLQDPALQLHVAVWNQLAHHRLALDLKGREGEGQAEEKERLNPLVCYLEVGDLSGDGLAEPGHGVRVLADRDHVVVLDGGEALVVQQLFPDLGQAGLKLLLLAHVSVGSHKDDRGQRSDGLKRSSTAFSFVFAVIRKIYHNNISAYCN